MISKTTIDNVFETARVEEVIGDFVQLKKSGSNFKGLSPFSDERTPSFMVSPVKQIWKDFSSGKGGNVVAFLMEHEHFTYPEAIKYLAKKYGIEIEETQQSDEQKQEADERESLYLVSEYAKKYFHDTLLNAPEGKAIGLSYYKERGFTQETVKTFNLGYSLDSWEAFTGEALKNEYQLKFLEKTGLTIVKDEKKFDRFKGRVMFPILSLSGRTLGFGGRILNNQKKAAKYLNSPESPIYNKSKILYGIFQAKQFIAKEDNCYLVEGYTDVIQFYQKGVKNVVSSSGTALTSDQIRLISRLTQNITLLFDGDAAGLRASLRGVDLILEQGMNVSICTFPEGEDPDSFAKTHTLEELSLYLKQNARDFINFKASILASDSANNPIKRAETIRDIVTSISKIPDPIKREVYLRECATVMNISEPVLFNTMAQIRQKNLKDSYKTRENQQETFEVISQVNTPIVKVDKQFELERKILEILLLYGNEEDVFEDLIIKTDDDGEIVMVPEKYNEKVFNKVYLDLQEDEIEFANTEFKELYLKIIGLLSQGHDFKVDNFVNHLPPNMASVITHILMDEEKHELHNWSSKEIYVKEKNQSIAQMVSETILNLRHYLLIQKIDTLAKSINQIEDSKKKETLQAVMDYGNLKKMLSEKLRRVL